jgi:hypothetical protein
MPGAGANNKGIPLVYPPLSVAENHLAVCQAPGCQNPPHGGPGNDYCSMAHKTSVQKYRIISYHSLARDSLGETLCLMCLLAPKMANSHFCSQTCIDDVEAKGPMVLEVPLGHATFKSGPSSIYIIS